MVISGGKYFHGRAVFLLSGYFVRRDGILILVGIIFSGDETVQLRRYQVPWYYLAFIFMTGRIFGENV